MRSIVMIKAAPRRSVRIDPGADNSRLRILCPASAFCRRGSADANPGVATGGGRQTLRTRIWGLKREILSHEREDLTRPRVGAGEGLSPLAPVANLRAGCRLGSTRIRHEGARHSFVPAAAGWVLGNGTSRTQAHTKPQAVSAAARSKVRGDILDAAASADPSPTVGNPLLACEKNSPVRRGRTIDPNERRSLSSGPPGRRRS